MVIHPPKILFTSPCGPYPKMPVEKDPIDYFYYRNTLKQGLFQLRSFQSWHSLHFIAQNISVPSMVLDNPNFLQLKNEIENGKYSILAIGFTVVMTRRVYEMLKWLRASHPYLKIILGGYGTAVFHESSALTDEMKSMVDYICFGEGVQEINRIIYEVYGIQNKLTVTQDLLPAVNSLFRTKFVLFRQIILIGGLGCVYGCSFCATSSQFKGKYIPLFTGEKLVEALIIQSKKYPDIKSAIIYDEDFLLNKKQFNEFKECFKKSELSETPFFITIFSSVKSIMEYSFEELIECGIGTIFIGVESFDEGVLKNEKLIKRRGEVIELFKNLHAHGIHTLGSLVLGWDSQTKVAMQKDTENFVSLNPTFYQIIPLQAVPGTKLWDKLKEEARTKTDFTSENEGITNINFKPSNVSEKFINKLALNTYENLVRKGGPWPFRMFENLLNGALNLRKSNSLIYRKRAQFYSGMLFNVGLLAFISGFLFHDTGFNKSWRHVFFKFAKNFTLKFFLICLLFPFAFILLLLISSYDRIKHYFSKNGEQPDFVRTFYRIEKIKTPKNQGLIYYL